MSIKTRAWRGMVGHGEVRLGMARSGMARRGLVGLAIVLAGCQVEISPLQSTSVPTTEPQFAEPASTIAVEATLIPTLVPQEDQWAFIIGGIDRAEWRDDDPRRAHLDYFMIAVVQDKGDVARVVLLQVPRNLYVPVPGLEDDFAFGYYSRGGLPMVKQWVEGALGIAVHGMVVARMDDFVHGINDIGGLTVGGTHYTGEELLYHVRFHLFDTGSYDPAGIHFEVLEALADKIRQKLTDPESAFGLVIRYLPLVETDLSPGGMVDFLFSQGLPLVQGRYSVERVRLEDALCYEDIPFENPGTSKGLLVCDGINLHEWVQSELK